MTKSTTVHTKIVILGGGFGGLQTALALEKTIAADPGIEVALISRENYALFTPMLHEVGAGDMDISDIVCPLRPMLRHVRFLQADVEEIDLRNRQVYLQYGVYADETVLDYDHLVIALGSEPNFFDLPGVAERAFTMRSLGDAFILRNQALAMLELASLTKDEAVRRSMLTFVVAGGGFAGVETIGALNDYLREALSYYSALTEEELRLVLVHPEPGILPELNPSLGRYAQSELTARKVEILTGASVRALTEAGVQLSSGATIPAQTLVWTAGAAAPVAVSSLNVRKDRGRIVVNETLEAPEHPGVWAIGDCACIPNPETGKPHPPTAQHALREAVQCAKNIAAATAGRPKAPFRFKTLGQLATIGHHAGVAEVFGFRLSGFAAWCLWRAVYLMKLPTLQKKLRVALRWVFSFAFPRDLTQHVTLHGIERLGEMLANARRHRVLPRPAPSDEPRALTTSS